MRTIATILLLALAVPAVAQETSFTIAERRAIIDHFADKAPSVPTTEQAPRRAEIGDVLPPGMAVAPLPADLEKELPPRPKPEMRGVIGRDVVLMDGSNGRVLDLLVDAARQ